MGDEIRPFKIQVSEADLEDLKKRLRATRWPDPQTVPDWSQGVPLDYVQKTCESHERCRDAFGRPATVKLSPSLGASGIQDGQSFSSIDTIEQPPHSRAWREFGRWRRAPLAIMRSARHCFSTW